jgi:ubiquinone/menaquinone biosynthesis C-methylase UbiE
VKLERTPSGIVIHSPFAYDLRLWLRARGRGRAFREALVELAGVATGESLLDVGSATGSLALAAKRRVGRAGTVHGIEPSPAMVAWARRKAALARLDVTFREATAQALPYADGSFDVATATLVLHQLPHDSWRPALSQLRRVVVRGGRLLLVDLDAGEPGADRSTPHAHGSFDLDRLVPLVEQVGFQVAGRGPVPFRLARFERLRYVLAAA